MLGFVTGAACAALYLRLRQIREEEEGIEALSDRISDHLEELERRTAAVPI